MIDWDHYHTFLHKENMVSAPRDNGRGYPSLVKGAGFRVPSRRRSQVQLLLHAFLSGLNGLY
jgi:hypothetical protein